MKRLRLFAILAAALASAVVALPYLISAEQFRPTIQTKLQAALGRPVEFGALSLRVIPISLRATGLNIHGLATVDVLDVRVRILPLLQGNVEVDSLILTRPVVTAPTGTNSSSSNSPLPQLNSLQIIDGRLLANGSEFSNIDADLHSAQDSLSGTLSWENGTLPVQLAFDAARAGAAWNLSRLDASMGKVTAAFTGQIDPTAGTVNGRLQVKPSPLEGLPVKTAYKPTGTLTADVQITGPYKQPNLSGGVHITQLSVTGGQLSAPLKAGELHLNLTPGRIAAAPFSLQVGPTLVQAQFQLQDYKTIDATISTRDASLRDLLAIAQVNDINGTGAVTVELHATGPLSKPNLAGSGSLSNADLHLAALTPNLKIDSAQIRFEEDAAAIDNATLHIGKSTAKGSVKFHNFAQPQLALSLQIDQLSNTEMQSWIPSTKDSGPSKPLTLTGDIGIGKLELNALTLENVKTALTLKDKLLTLSPLTASVYGGRISGSATANLKNNPPVIALKTHLDKIESEQLLSATTPLRKVISGPLSGDADLQFSPKPGEDFTRTLNGALQLQLAQGKLIPVNVLGELGTVARFIKPLNASSTTSVLGMKGLLKLKNGTAETDDLRLELDRAAALITGTANLTDQSLNLRMLTTFNKQLSDEVGGSKIGGFLSSAMASPKGELLMPSLVRGTFAKPVISPDAAAVGKMKLNSAGNIQESVQGVMDLFRPKKKQP